MTEQTMTEITQPTDAQELREAFTAADMATAAAQGFRDGVASVAVSAGSEPVAWKHDCAALLANDVELWIDACPHCGKPRMHATQAAQHGQVPAIQRYKIGYHTDEWGVRSLSPTGIYDDAGPWVRYEDHAAVTRAGT